MNYAEKNLQNQKELEREKGMPLREIAQNDPTGFSHLHLTWKKDFVCSKCGGHVTLPNLEFFDYDVTRVMCYKCQDKNY